MGQFISPLLLERYELKYLIPLELVDKISQYVEIFCELDPYSEREDDNYYKVNNIYLDSPNYLFLQRRLAGISNRFNLRVRAYGDEALFPYFCEVKHKTMGIVKKRRAKISEDNWQQIFGEDKATPHEEQSILNDTEDYKSHFLRLSLLHNAEPKIFTQYRRKAYASVVDEYARVTFDRDLRYQRRETYNLKPTEEKLSHYDTPLKFAENTNIIMELKCTTNVPKWFVDLITQFRLERTSFSKYVTGIQEVVEDNIPYIPARVANMQYYQ